MYLVVRADETMRVVSRWPSLRPDEIAFRLNVTFPTRPWGRIQDGDIAIDIPSALPPEVELDPDAIHPQPIESAS